MKNEKQKSEHEEECCCHNCHSHEEHEHGEHEEELSPLMIIISAVFFAGGIFAEHFFPDFKIISLALFAAAYIICGKDVVKEAFESIFHGELFNEEFLMALATIGAIAIGEYAEAVAVMILFQTGEFLEDKASDKTRDAISSLVDIRSENASVIRGGKEIEVHPSEVRPGEIIVVKPGERIPLDGILTEGSFLADTSALTGESIPRSIQTGEEVLSGYINTNTVIKIQITKEFSKSAVSRILEMVEEAQEKKASSQKFISRFAKIYTPIVCLIAVLAAILPPLLLGSDSAPWKVWLYRACEMLVVSCPCALVISVPLTFFAGLGLASKNGILIKGSNYLELLSKAEIAVFDKTGTITKGVFQVTEIHPAANSGLTEDQLLAAVTHAEYYSTHPVSRSLKEVHNCSDCNSLTPEQAEEISGHGIKCIINNSEILCGNKRLMQKENVEAFEEYNSHGTIIYCSIDRKFAGWILISDAIKPEAKETIEKLHKIGIKLTVMLSGDSRKNAESVAEITGIDKVYSELLPQDKVSQLEKIMKENSGKPVIFTGDGINDAPVLSASSVGIAMGGIGSEAAIEAADAVIMDDNILKIPAAIKISAKTMSKVRQNIFFSLSIKIALLILCGLGFANMWMAVFGDVGVTLLAVLNSTSLLWKKKI